MKRLATIDRFEGDLAVLFFDKQTSPYNLPRQQLPAASKPGDVLMIEITNNEIIHVVIDVDATQARAARIQAKLEKLQRGEHLDPK